MNKRAKPAKPAVAKKRAAPQEKRKPKPASSGKPRRTIPVHALADERVHLAPAHLGRLRQGQLKTLCGKVAVSELSPFALAGPKSARCRVCFGKVDGEGLYSAG